jgi:hypothetical protein
MVLVFWILRELIKPRESVRFDQTNGEVILGFSPAFRKDKVIRVKWTKSDEGTMGWCYKEDTGLWRLLDLHTVQ